MCRNSESKFKPCKERFGQIMLHFHAVSELKNLGAHAYNGAQY